MQGFEFLEDQRARGGGRQRREPRLAATARGSDSPNFRGRPPARLLMLVGREAEVSEVRNSIRRGRFVTVLGPVGIGTATVAVAARRDADSRLIAALAHALKARR
jgi:hypothetical protein